MKEMQETQVPSLGWEDPLEEEVAIHSSILAWEIAKQKNLAGYSLGGWKESDTTEYTSINNQRTWLKDSDSQRITSSHTQKHPAPPG